MPNIAALLKNEISRVARKVVRAETEALTKAARAYRSEIAALKRRTHDLEQEIRRLAKVAGRSGKLSRAAVDSSRTEGLRFSAKGLIAQRRRLGLSAAECGLLVGASAQSIYNWEVGKVRPRTKHLTAIVGLRALGKKEAAARLATV